VRARAYRPHDEARIVIRETRSPTTLEGEMARPVEPAAADVRGDCRDTVLQLDAAQQHVPVGASCEATRGRWHGETQALRHARVSPIIQRVRPRIRPARVAMGAGHFGAPG
jgi:hypothetical protein